MILLIAVLIISFEAIGEGFLKRFSLAEIIFENWIQWLIALFLFWVWFLIVINIDTRYIPTWKLITGDVFVRFAIFDLLWNIARGVRWDYYGTTKLYDRIMTKMGGFGLFAKVVFGIVGICFLMGWDTIIIRTVKSFIF